LEKKEEEEKTREENDQKTYLEEKFFKERKKMTRYNTHIDLVSRENNVSIQRMMQ
jgi:hypothetical protein